VCDQENLRGLYTEMTKFQNDQRKLNQKIEQRRAELEQMRTELARLEHVSSQHERLVVDKKQKASCYKKISSILRTILC
jgi:chromosome segregation ATPase